MLTATTLAQAEETVAQRPRASSRTPRELGLVRTTVDVPELQHRRLKIAAVQRGMTIRELLLELLDREGITNT